MAKILSKNINVYPTGFRGLNDADIAFDPESIYNTEDNLTRPYKFISNGNYVINDAYTEGGKFELILGGYYFTIRNFEIPDDLTDKSQLFAHIKIEPKGNPQDEDNTQYIANALRPLDVSNVDDLDSKQSGEYYFDGLIIDDSQSNANYSETLLILKKSGESWIVPEKSKLRFSPRHIEGGTDYNTHSAVGLNNQLDTKLVYNPDGGLTVQGKDQVEIKSVDSSATAKVNTVWNTSAESIISKGKKIEAYINESSIKNRGTKMSLDKYGIQFSKIKDEDMSSIVRISDDEILLQNKDVSSIGPKGEATISVKTINGNNSSIDLGIKDDVYNSKIKIDQYGVSISGNNNYITGSTQIKGSIPGQNIDIETMTGSSLNIKSTGANSPINISAGTDCSLSGGSSVVSFIGPNLSSANSLIELSSSKINASAESSIIASAPTIELCTHSNDKIRIIDESSITNSIMVYPNLSERTSAYLGTIAHHFTHGYIDNLNGSQITINGSNTSGAIRVNVGSSESSNYGLIVASSSASTATATKISPVCVVTQSYYATSDRRLKENIKPFNYSKAITDIEVKEFNFKGDKNKTIGIIAQDLQEIYPELVHENENGYLSIQEDKLIYLLLEEVKELKKEVNNLKNIKK